MSGKRVFDYSFCVYLIISFTVLDGFTLLFVNALGGDFVQTAVFQSVLFIAVCFYAVKVGMLKLRWFRLAIAIYGLLALYGLVNGGGLVAIVGNARNLFVLPVLLVGYIVSYSKLNLRSTYVFLLSLLLVCLIFHFIQLLVGFESYFYGLGIDNFYASRGISPSGSLPIGFVYYNSVTHTFDTRFTGIFLSPDKLSYLVLAFLGYFHGRRFRNAKPYSLFFVSTVVVSASTIYFFQTKAILLFYMVFLFNVVCVRMVRIWSFPIRLSLSAGVCFLSILVVLSIVPASTLSSSGAIQHLWGLTNPFLNTSISKIDFYIGNGLGSGGTIGRVYEERDFLNKADVGGESFVGSVFYQAGIVGLALFLFVYKKVDDLAKKIQISEGYCYTSSFLVSILIVGSISESYLSMFQSSSYSLFIFIVLSSIGFEKYVIENGRSNAMKAV